jgi:hypothetical protein
VSGVLILQKIPKARNLSSAWAERGGKKDLEDMDKLLYHPWSRIL